MLNKKTSLYLLAANRLMRETLAKLFAKKGGFHLCGMSPFKIDVVAGIRSLAVDILVMDLVTVRLSGFSLISDLVGLMPDLKVALIDMENDPAMFVNCVRVGAVGYFLGDASAAEVIAGLQSVAEGQAVCPPHLALALFKAFSRQSMSLPSGRVRLELGLTRRQQQLIPFIAQGLTNKEIAAQLGVSEGTIKNHVHEILQRMGADDRLEIVDRTRLSGIVIPSRPL